MGRLRDKQRSSESERSNPCGETARPAERRRKVSYLSVLFESVAKARVAKAQGKPCCQSSASQEMRSVPARAEGDDLNFPPASAFCTSTIGGPVTGPPICADHILHTTHLFRVEGEGQDRCRRKFTRRVTRNALPQRGQKMPGNQNSHACCRDAEQDPSLLRVNCAGKPHQIQKVFVVFVHRRQEI